MISGVQPLITTYALQHLELPREPYILDIDLDFRAPETGNNIESHLTSLQTLIQNAEAVTIATSPYFLDQDLAIEMVKNIFS
ncbi:MAG: hypothetical protein LBI53_05790 [Candidatus Peribacteria bacterium]|nr:hypothetical protein [Candidatus Peribacteria bacterium]